MIPRILIVAGSDSSGGAGIQADIKTVTMLGGYAACAVTAVTVQDTTGVHAVHAIPADAVAAQMRAVIDDIGVNAVKLGMLGSAEVIAAVAGVLRGLSVPIVLDPVMVAKGGASLLDDGEDGGAVAALLGLLPLATLVTPNTPELAALTGTGIDDEGDALLAAQELIGLGARAVLAKGGHLPGAEVADWLVTRNGHTRFAGPRIASRHTHGTGCTLASAVAVGLGRGDALADAVAAARAYVVGAIEHAPGFGQGHGPLGHNWSLTYPCHPRESGDPSPDAVGDGSPLSRG